MMHLLSLSNSVSGYRLKLINISLIVNNKLHLSQLYCFWLVLLMTWLLEMTCVCTNKINLWCLKWSLYREYNNHYKRVLEAAELAYLNKPKHYITSQKLGLWNFRQFAKIVLNNCELAIPPPFNGPVVFSSASDKAKLLGEIFSENSNLDDSELCVYLASVLEPVWKCILKIKYAIFDWFKNGSQVNT